MKPRIARKRDAPRVVPAAIPPRRPDTPRRPADAVDEARAPDAARPTPRPSPNGADDTSPTRSARTLVASGLSAAEIGTLERLGFRQVRRTAGRALPAVLTLSVPQAVDIDTARETARRVTTAAVDFDHFYYTDGHGTTDCVGGNCPPVPAPLWVSARTAHCGVTPTIGLVDTAIARDHPALVGQSIVVLGPDGRPGDAAPMRPVRGEAAMPADGDGGSTHGTAIAALLVGRADGRVPGLLPEATLVAVNAFTPDDQGRERTDVATLVDAIEHLAARGVRVINLSLSGPPNAVLEAAVGAAARDGIVLVAAAGNGGPYAEPAFPAAYPNVIAVTAVDRTLDVYRRATRGTYVDFAAPGVEVWTAAAGPMSGTSYAVPFVTAAVAAHLAARPGASPAAVAGHLAASAFDLGAAGRDDTYGWGLVRADSCPGTQPPSVEQAGADIADPTRPDRAAPARRASPADRFGPAAGPRGADAPERAGDSIQAVR
ncbi:S8 family serine peptidase [Mongoliimonas terrestris]|uniref:S8 family serine peptidase n=1 Tax=Mongoliimonas terrestris TaxID=1709001 RepID=UPI0009495315|nr:S8 family serine peptidase [Mongoliimonas terrestris]